MKTKALISFAVTAKLICAFVFAYADCWFSHEAAHLMTLNFISVLSFIMKTCSCNMQGFFSLAKIEDFIGNNLII